MVLIASRASAVDRFWINTGGGLNNWNDALNWDPNSGFAQAGDNAFFDQDAIYTVIVQSPSAADNATFSDGSVTLGGGTLNIGSTTTIDDPNATALANGAIVTNSGPVWDNVGNAFVGDAGFGSLTIDGGGDFTSFSLFIGDDPNSQGEVNVQDIGSTLISDGTSAADGIFIGNAGTGTLNVTSGGAVQITDNTGSISDIELGVGATGDGTLVIDGAGSSVTAEDVLIGFAGAGHLTVSGGGLLDQSIAASPDAFVALDPNSSGDVTVTGDNSLWNMRDALVGNSGAATLLIETGGKLDASGLMTLGDDPNSSGAATVTGTGTSDDSLLEVGGILTVGNGGQGTLGVDSGGGVTVGDDLNVGNNAGALFDNVVTVTGAGSTITISDRVNVGLAGRGTLDVLDGGVVNATSTVIIGGPDDSVGASTVDGVNSQLTTVGSLIVGNEGFGTLDVTGGGFVQSARLEIGDSDTDNDDAGMGTVTVSGSGGGSPSRINVTSGDFFVGGSTNENGGTGTLHVENGGLVTSNGMSIGSGNGGGSDGSGAVVVKDVGSLLDADANGSNTLFVGDTGDGSLNVSDGGKVEANAMTVGNEAGTEDANANVNDSGSRIDLSAALVVGQGRKGSMTIGAGGVLVSGANDTSTSSIGVGSGSDGSSVSVEGAGSLWDHQGSGASTTRIRVGVAGGQNVDGMRSRLSVSDGGKVLAHDLLVADGSVNGVGELIVDGMADPNNVSTVSANGFVVIGDDSLGLLTVSNGGLMENTVGSIEIGGTPNGMGVATVKDAGSMLSAATFFNVGRSNDGALIISDGGTVSNAGDGNVSRDSGANSTVVIASSTANPSTWNNGASLYVGGDSGGAGGTASFQVDSGGVVDVAATMKVWGGATVTLNGGTIETNSLEVVEVGDFVFSTGTLRFSGDQTLDPISGGTLDQIFAGAAVPTLGANQHLEIVGNATLAGQLRLNDVTASLSVGTVSDLSNLDWDAGTLDITAQSLTVGGGELLGESVIVDQNQTLSVSNSSHSVTVNAGADLNVIRGGLDTAATTNDGLIVISNTTNVDFDLDDNGSGLTNNKDLVAIDSTIAGAVVNNGQIEIVGTVNFTDGVSLAVSGSLGIDINGLLDFDAISVGEDASLGGALSVDVDGYSLSIGDSFEIIDIDGTQSGTFTGLADGALVGNYGGVDLFIDYDGGDGNDVTLLAALPGDFVLNGQVDGFDFLAWQRGESSTPLSQSDLNDWETNYGMTAPLAAVSAAVPEPATWCMMLMGLAAVLMVKRQGKRA